MCKRGQRQESQWGGCMRHCVGCREWWAMAKRQRTLPNPVVDFAPEGARARHTRHHPVSAHCEFVQTHLRRDVCLREAGGDVLLVRQPEGVHEHMQQTSRPRLGRQAALPSIYSRSSRNELSPFPCPVCPDCMGPQCSWQVRPIGAIKITLPARCSDAWEQHGDYGCVSSTSLLAVREQVCSRTTQGKWLRTRGGACPRP